MRNFKTLATSLVALFLMVAFSSCEKQTAKVDDGLQEVEISFANVTADLQKKAVINTKDLIPWECSDAEPAMVEVTISGDEGEQTFDLPILSGLDGNQTVVLKVAPGAYEVTSFIVKDAQDNPMAAAPMAGSQAQEEYGDWLVNKLNVGFVVEAFTKIKVTVDVLCFTPYEYIPFGYFWLDFNRVEVKTLCFWGDICTPFYLNWGESQMDFPAGFKVEIVYGGETLSEATQSQGANEPLCIEYPYSPDMEYDGDYGVRLSVFTPTGHKLIGVFSLDPSADPQEFYDNNLIGDDDGVDSDMIFDFVVYDEGAECNYEGNQNVNFTSPMPVIFD